MKFIILAVGKLKERFWTDACKEYTKRLQPYASTKVVELVDNGKDRETAQILNFLNSYGEHTHVCALDIKAQQFSSTELTSHIEKIALHGTSSFIFIIGGSEGLDKEVLEECDSSISFGPITLPHNLARVVLLEQLYRTRKIARGEPYHK